MNEEKSKSKRQREQLTTIEDYTGGWGVGKAFVSCQSSKHSLCNQELGEA